MHYGSVNIENAGSIIFVKCVVRRGKKDSYKILNFGYKVCEVFGSQFYVTVNCFVSINYRNVKSLCYIQKQLFLTFFLHIGNEIKKMCIRYICFIKELIQSSPTNMTPTWPGQSVYIRGASTMESVTC